MGYGWCVECVWNILNGSEWPKIMVVDASFLVGLTLQNCK
jgi:hypothetical protein